MFVGYKPWGWNSNGRSRCDYTKVEDRKWGVKRYNKDKEPIYRVNMDDILCEMYRNIQENYRNMKKAFELKAKEVESLKALLEEKDHQLEQFKRKA